VVDVSRPHAGPTLEAVAEPVRVNDYPAAQEMDDSIPALDNEPSAESTPGAERKPTIAAWLDQLASKLERCTDREEVEGLLLSDEVCRAGRTLRGAARERLRELMDAGWPSTAEPCADTCTC
jgi:hypothetical protein